MNQNPSLDDLDRLLTNTAGRLADPRRPRPLGWSSRLRRAWDRHRAWVKALCYGGPALYLLSQGSYRSTITFVVLLLLYWLPDHLEQRKRVEALDSDEDFLAGERAFLVRRRMKELIFTWIALAFAALMCVTAIFGKYPLAAGAVAAFVVCIVALRWVLFMPGLKRELADLGVEPESRGTESALTAFFVLLAMFIVPVAMLYRGVRAAWRKLRGLPPEPDEDADDSEADDSDTGGRA
jgi:uncharacterized membrane protein